MTKQERESINKKISLSFEFTKSIIDNPTLLDKIPNGATIEFLENGKEPEKAKTKRQRVKYVKVKNEFELV